MPEAMWTEAVERWGVRWEWSLPVTESYDLAPFPDARVVMPRTYANLGEFASRGRCIPVSAEDLPALLSLPIERKVIDVRTAVSRIVSMNPSDPDVKRLLSQLAMGIQQRIQQSGQERISSHPFRKGPNLSEIIASLNQKWAEQGGRCLLCERPIPLRPSNSLLKASPDRIDSDDKSYAADNVHLTHLGCNLAKNKASVDEWKEYLAMLREDA
ncbi:hypothetical protein [Caulobacter sp. 17J80-11]|uniref:hypothetical protein n=1 Tax=Caulobacter sp. 17J80-11 TaxID=2763502 RepID=UPI0016538842|nr:hypothetical protein [Caulobacter sp. 17J80-11]MBC6983795.1 hypothetical protein [Caulobacter sp. 17J80-11]